MKKVAVLFKLLLLIFTTTPVVAQSLKAEQLLARDIMAGSKVLSKDVSIFNYFYFNGIHPQFETTAGRHDFVQGYLQQRAGDFWNLDFHQASPSINAAGAGLYFAIDPHISRTFGNYYIQIDMPRGVRFINVVSPIPVRKDTQAALIAEGYTTASQLAELFPKGNGFYRDTLRLMVLIQHENFRKVVHRIFTQNNIQFVEYNFNTSLSGFCSSHSYSAFNYVGQHNAANPSHALVDAPYKNIALHSAEYTLPGRSLAEITQAEAAMKYRNVLENIPKIRSQGKSVREYILREYSQAEYNNIKLHTFSCEDEYARRK